MSVNYKAIAKLLESAEIKKSEVTKITMDYPEISIEDAYIIQEEIVQIKLAKGHKVVGPKMGLTSKTKMRQMGVEEPICGYVFDYMIEDSGTVNFSDFIHPKVELEIAFLMGKDLSGSNITVSEVLDATDYVMMAVEIIDSRYKNFQFTLRDVVADNTSASCIIVGNTVRKPKDLDLRMVAGSLTINGEIVATGMGANILGNPAESIAALSRMLYKRNKFIKRGDLIMAGAMTEAIPIKMGDIVFAECSGLSAITFKVD